MYTDIDQLIGKVTELFHQVKARPEVKEFKKGMTLWVKVPGMWNVGVTVLRVNKKTLTVQRHGMVGSNKFAENPKNYPTMNDRTNKVDIHDLLTSGCYEMSRNEIAFCVYVSWLRRKLEKLAKAQEMACCVGSKKYNDLKSGKLHPRNGDFVKSRLTGCCGVIVNNWLYQDTLGYGVSIIDANGKDQFLTLDDVLFIAPKEWEEI